MGNSTSYAFPEWCLFTLFARSKLLYLHLTICTHWKKLLSKMNHDFISNLKFLIDPFHIFLSLILCIQLYDDVFPHSSWMFFKCSTKSFASALLVSPLSNFLNSETGTTPIYNLEWWFSSIPIDKNIICKFCLW